MYRKYNVTIRWAGIFHSFEFPARSQNAAICSAVSSLFGHDAVLKDGQVITIKGVPLADDVRAVVRG